MESMGRAFDCLPRRQLLKMAVWEQSMPPEDGQFDKQFQLQFCSYMTGLHDWWSQWDNYSPNTCMTSRAAILVVVGHCGTSLLFTCHIKTPPYPNLTSNDLNRHPQRRYSIISVNAVCAKILQILNVDLTDLQRSLRVIRINVNW